MLEVVEAGQWLRELIEKEELAKIEKERVLAWLSCGITKDQHESGKFMGKVEFTAYAKAQPEYVDAARAWALAYAERRGFEKGLDMKRSK